MRFQFNQVKSVPQNYVTQLYFLSVEVRQSLSHLHKKIGALTHTALTANIRTKRAAMYYANTFSLHAVYGWVENEDLRPKTQKRRPPSKSLINIQKGVSRPQMCKKQQYLQLYKISTRVFVFYTIPPVCRKRRPPSKSLGNGWKLHSSQFLTSLLYDVQSRTQEL